MDQPDPPGLLMVSKVIDHEVTRYGKPKFIEDSGVSRSSIDKAIARTIDFDSDVYDRIERWLGLPPRTFAFIALGKIDDLEHIGVSKGLVAWIRDGGEDPIAKRPNRRGGKTA